jgi:hypothetical protein
MVPRGLKSRRRKKPCALDHVYSSNVSLQTAQHGGAAIDPSIRTENREVVVAFDQLESPRV